MTDKAQHIRYASCWEDADLLLSALNGPGNMHIISIGSGGDNSFSLLTLAPEKMVVVDTNALQLHLIRLKQQAFLQLDYSSFLGFLGFNPCRDRLEIYSRLRSALTAEARAYWDQSSDAISLGVIHAGKFERYLRMFGKTVLPMIHRSQTIEDLRRPKSLEDQKRFYLDHWDTWRWRALFRIFFSRWFMGTFGRDRAYLKQVDEHVSSFILDQTSRHLCSGTFFNNPFADYILTGRFQDVLPHYAREEHFEAIRSAIGRMELRLGTLSEVVGQGESFHRINASNIFEYMDQVVFRQQAELIATWLFPEGKVAYWNLMVQRHLHEAAPQALAAVPFPAEDRGFFYREFCLNEKKS